jgi:reactive intermediate/imine deaminase
MTGGAKKEVIATPDAPKAIGPYSQAIRVGNTVYLAGQIPIDPKTNQVLQGTIEQQTRLVMDNLGAVLKAAGMGFEHVVMGPLLPEGPERFSALQRGLRDLLQARHAARTRDGAGGAPAARRACRGGFCRGEVIYGEKVYCT